MSNSALRWEADARIRTGDPFITRDKTGGEEGTPEDTVGAGMSSKARAFVKWLDAGGDSVCTT
jgi:hypothetical protein